MAEKSSIKKNETFGAQGSLDNAIPVSVAKFKILEIEFRPDENGYSVPQNPTLDTSECNQPIPSTVATATSLY